MFGTDYIERMIHQFARFLARVLFKIQNGNLNEARGDIERAADQFLGLPWHIILGLSDQALDDLLSIDGQRRDERSYAAGQLLACEAKIRDADGSIEAEELYLRSLHLLLRAFPRLNEGLQAEAISAIDQNLGALGGQHLSPDVYRMLVTHFESQGKFSKAEDTVFKLAECDPEEALGIGVAFYERAFARTDEELERGNLPRSEVAEGLQELRMRYGAPSSA